MDSINKSILPYSSVCDELEYFKKEGRIDQETFDELNKLRTIFNYLMEYKY